MNHVTEQQLREKIQDAICPPSEHPTFGTMRLGDDFGIYKTSEFEIVGNMSGAVDRLRDLILQERKAWGEQVELSRFSYVDWELGDDNILRIGDYINCNHQRPYDGYERNFEGQIIYHPDNGMPVILYNVDEKDPDNSGDYAALQDLYMGGWEFSRIKQRNQEEANQ